MFNSARIKLTAWYLLIITVICGLFSVMAYRSLTMEINRGMRQQSLRFIPPPSWINLDQEFFLQAKKRVALDLFMLNIGILAVSGVAAYFLAGRTLKPIEVMVEDQKRFVADASHELRTPLTAMKTEIEVAIRSKKLTLSQARQLITSNLEEVDKMQSLTNYLLSLNRYQNNQFKLPMTSVDISQIISQSVSAIKPLADKKHITIEVNIHPGNFTGNQLSLVELFTLLLDNAVKYSHAGSRVVIENITDHKFVSISVLDYGIGIKAGDIPYIFNRFYRADASRSKSHTEGYGLGLSIAKNIVNLHHGQISVASTPGTGSTFTVKLPLRAF